MVTHRGSVRKRTGGRKRHQRDRRKHELGREPTETTLDDQRLKTVSTRGTGRKVRALATDEALLSREGDTIMTTIEDVIENGANPNYVRRNIITKGAIVKTADGRARVTSRPGQTGQVCAVAVDE